MLIAESAEDVRRLREAGLSLLTTNLDVLDQPAIRSFSASSSRIFSSVSP
jgi:hypothetical protein